MTVSQELIRKLITRVPIDCLHPEWCRRRYDDPAVIAGLERGDEGWGNYVTGRWCYGEILECQGLRGGKHDQVCDQLTRIMEGRDAKHDERYRALNSLLVSVTQECDRLRDEVTRLRSILDDVIRISKRKDGS
jgi:hypothetical protein